MDLDLLRALPKIELHDHLDGGLRVATMLELADQIGRELPADDPDELAAWFYQGDSGSLVQYLAAFEHTVALMQTATAVERIAYEAALDLVADGVIYGEIRYAPVLTTRGDLSREDSIEAALSGFAQAKRETGVTVNLIIDAMRNHPDSLEDARAAVRFKGDGVVGFDLAGPESGFPAEDHAAACRLARDGGIHITVHAGEAAGPESIAGALDACHAERIGHGVSIVDDIGPDGAMGPIATRVHDEAIPLEVCPTSNLHTFGIEPQEHPLGRLYRAGFNVTLNTDNRLMSRVTLTDEFHLATKYHGMGKDDLHRISRASATAAFTDDATRRKLCGAIDRGYSR
jgi:adenosine deaminase